MHVGGSQIQPKAKNDMKMEYIQGSFLSLKNDTKSEAFGFTSDAAREWQALFQLHFKLLTEERCCLEVESTLRRRMTKMIDKLVEEGKIFAAAIMCHDRDLLFCSQRRCSNSKCPIQRFLNECLHAINSFQPRNFKKKQLIYIA